jgi:putative transposase
VWKNDDGGAPEQVVRTIAGSVRISLEAMPRAPRVLVAGAIYHVMSRGNRKQPIFLTDSDHILFLQLCRKVFLRRNWIVHCYCLMPNHYHLVLETPGADLSAGMREINGEYAQWFNRNHGFVGHVFQGRFKAIIVESSGHLLHVTRYIATNPSRAGLCSSPAMWRWSSYTDLINDTASPLPSSSVLSFFGEDKRRGREVLRRFVEDVP